MSDDIKLKRFGKYLILDHLVDGGMAKICRARYLGEQADKIVAIKMVQPQFSKDESFKTMFMDEVKVTFGLQHPNIVQTYDYGYYSEQLYVAMEYCDGRNLKEYLDQLKQRGYIFPIEISVYITSQACQGLFYAHTLTDKLTGKDANIIHRDISPHNIMLTYDGAIKVIDFGIAKADSNSEATQAGTIKGKLSYLAPEYLEGQELDPRYDQFAIGITLWEMLCSRKLFKAANDLAVLKKIQECKVPAPSSINPIVPKELDEIVLKSLSKDRNKRFKDLNEMNKALTKFLYTYKPDFNATDLSYFAKELFKEDIKKDREKLFEYGKIDIKPFIEEMKNEASGGGGGASASAGVDASGSAAKGNQVLDFGFEEDKPEEKIPTMRALREGKKPHATKKTNKNDLGLEIEQTPKRKKKDDATSTRRIKTSNATGTKQIKRGTTTKRVRTKGKKGSTKTRKTKAGVTKSSSPVTGLIVAAGIAGAIFFSKDTLVAKFGHIIGINPPKSAATSIKKNPTDNPGQGKKPASIGNITFLNIDKHKQKVFINGEKRDVNFLGQIKVPLGEKFTLRVESPGKEHYVTTLMLGSDELEKNVTIEDTKPASYGYLMSSRECLSGKLEFSMFGEGRLESLPLERPLAFPLGLSPDGKVAPTTHSISYIRPDGIKKKVSFELKYEDDTIDICEL